MKEANKEVVLKPSEVKEPGHYWVAEAGEGASSWYVIEFDAHDISRGNVYDDCVFIGPISVPSTSVGEAVNQATQPAPIPEVVVMAAPPASSLAVPPVLQRSIAAAPALTKVEKAGPPALVKVGVAIIPPLERIAASVKK